MVLQKGACFILTEDLEVHRQMKTLHHNQLS